MLYKNPPKKFKPKFEIVSCYMEHKNNILLLHRHPHKSEGNKWGVPAGKMDPGEDVHAAMVREIREETGQKIAPEKLEYLSKTYVKYPDYHFVYHMFRTRMETKPKVVLSKKEHQAFQWIPPGEALKINLARDLDRCIKLSYGAKL